MARKKERRANDEQINRMFERQKRRLNRKWLTNAFGGLILLAAILFALQFTPYGYITSDIINAAKNLVKSLTSSPSAPEEPDPKYW